MREIKQVHKAAKRLDREGGLSRSQLRLAQQNLLCFVSDLWLGSDGYQIAEARVAAAHAAAQAADGVNGAALKARADALATNLKAREDGPDQDYASFPVFKDYAMASFTVLISSAVVEGFFSQFAGMKDKTRNLMADQTWSWSMWTRMAVPINSEAAEGFDLEPKLKDDARKDRWTGRTNDKDCSICNEFTSHTTASAERAAPAARPPIGRLLCSSLAKPST